MQAKCRHILACLAAGAGLLALAPSALASITPTVTLDQSAGTQAGTTVPLGMDLKFSPTGSDSPKNLTLTLPPGLLANAAVDGGACLKSSTPTSACQVGSGTAKAALAALPPLTTLVPISLPVKFDLIAPPKPGDLAGLAVMVSTAGQTSQLGGPGAITIRPSSDPNGAGLNIVFTNLPDTFSGVQISLQELNSTFAGLRLPDSCPSSAAQVRVAATSYSAPSTQRTAKAPLHVTNCSKLTLTPAFHVRVAKDAHDPGVAISTTITQPDKASQSTSKTVKLTLPKLLGPNAAATLNGGILCLNPATGKCKPIGSASSTSPLYPTPLKGKVYLIGSLSANGPPLGISILFPAPFALRINGLVDLTSNSTTFHDVPDIPLTALGVTLNGGRNAVFETICKPPSGTATSTLTSQNGGRTVAASAPFTVSGCHATKPPKTGKPKIGSASASGLAHGSPKLRFALAAAGGAPKLSSFEVELPHGLSFAPGATHTGVSVTGGAVKADRLSHGHLIVTLQGAVETVGVQLRPKAVHESSGLESKAKHHQLGSLELTVVIKDAAGRSTTATHKLTG